MFIISIDLVPTVMTVFTAQFATSKNIKKSPAFSTSLLLLIIVLKTRVVNLSYLQDTFIYLYMSNFHNSLVL